MFCGISKRAYVSHSEGVEVSCRHFVVRPTASAFKAWLFAGLHIIVLRGRAPVRSALLRDCAVPAGHYKVAILMSDRRHSGVDLVPCAQVLLGPEWSSQAKKPCNVATCGVIEVCSGRQASLSSNKANCQGLRAFLACKSICGEVSAIWDLTHAEAVFQANELLE